MSIAVAVDSEHQAFVWNAEDACHLRGTHRIVGNLVGCLPRAPMQNIQLGLPMQLLPEEATLLFDKGLAFPVENDSDDGLPTAHQVETFKEFRSRQYTEQVEICQAERKEEILKMKDKIIAGKIKKLTHLEKEKKSSDEAVGESGTEKTIDISLDDIHIKPIPETKTLIQIFTENPWQRPQNRADWNYPNTAEEKIRCRVFTDLWEKGNYLTSGSKFGGDFLVYPGDPALFHSFYIAVCLPYKIELTALDLVSMGRLGANVKKTVLLCGVDEKDNVVYTSLQWTGMR